MAGNPSISLKSMPPIKNKAHINKTARPFKGRDGVCFGHRRLQSVKTVINDDEYSIAKLTLFLNAKKTGLTNEFEQIPLSFNYPT